MLHSYTFSNFQSFLEETRVDLTVTRKVADSDWISSRPTGERVSKVMAVLGANGAGKTALLKPAAFLGWFISQSFQNPIGSGIPVAPHFAASNEPSAFSCVVDSADGHLWRYELLCTRQRVLREALYRKEKRFDHLFIREWDEKRKNYRIRQRDFGLSDNMIENVRPDVSLISWAAQYGVPLALRIARPELPWVTTNVTGVGRIKSSDDWLYVAARHYFEHPQHKDSMNRLLSSWDLGLEGVEIRQMNFPNPQNPEQQQTVLLPVGKHRSHGKLYDLPFALESSGTQGAFIHLMRVLITLEHGGIAVIDEFESDLHPHMLEPLLGLFANPDTNPHNAQLLFTCHAAEVLNILHKSQVMLVEKDEDCESRAIRMDKVEGIRNDDNFYAKYMAGAYGAVPRI